METNIIKKVNRTALMAYHSYGRNIQHPI